MNEWKDLVMWDNTSFYYVSNKKNVSKEDLKEIKKILNFHVNNIAYDGYIKKNKINMGPTLKLMGSEIDYNISSYPLPSPEDFPKYIYSILPAEITRGDIKLTKHSYHAI